MNCLPAGSEPFHKSNKASEPRFKITPKGVASLAVESADYHRCRLVGYPQKMRYPESASELQQWHTWEASAYELARKIKMEDESPSNIKIEQSDALEVAEISDTLVFKLISAFLTGSETAGETIMLEFNAYKYRKCSNHLVGYLMHGLY